MLEMVAVAGCHADEEAIERALDDAALPYDTTLDATESAREDRVCMLGTSYFVDAQLAATARGRLRDAGLSHVVVTP